MKLILDLEGQSFSFILFSFHERNLVEYSCLTFLLNRSRSRSRSYSPSYMRRHTRGRHSDEAHRSKPMTPKIEYITEFGGSGDGNESKLEGYSMPRSPPQTDVLNRSEHSTFLILAKIDWIIFTLLQICELLWFTINHD